MTVLKKTIISLIFLITLPILLLGPSFAYADNAILTDSATLDSFGSLKDNLFKNLTSSINIGTTVPSLRLVNADNLSSADLVSALRSVAVLAINLFLIVIQTVASVLKALLPFLSGT